MVMTAMSDLKYCIIPDELIIAGCVFSVVAAMPHIMTAPGFANKLSPVFGAAIGAGIILAINLMGRLLYKKDALGMGDLKLMVVCGIACGAGGTLIALVIGILAAAVLSSVRVLFTPFARVCASPACGVRIVTAVLAQQSSGCCAAKKRASASIISGLLIASSPAIKAAVSGFLPKPGPTAMQSVFGRYFSI